MSRKRWLEYLISILLGNAIYFLALAQHLPQAFRHQVFQVDWGLALDFVVCAGVYGLLQIGKKMGFGSRRN